MSILAIVQNIGHRKLAWFIYADQEPADILKRLPALTLEKPNAIEGKRQFVQHKDVGSSTLSTQFQQFLQNGA
jgi:hypothetical protein